MTNRPIRLLLRPLLKHAIAMLAPRQPLRGCSARIRLRQGDCLAELVEVPGWLGCAHVETSGSQGTSNVVLDTPTSQYLLRIELRRTEPAEMLSTADFPVLSYLIERWHLDYALWDALLPRGTAASLPGRRLIVDGYGRRGRSVAWRARQLGLRVTVQERDSARLLDAVFDGFTTCLSPSADGSLYLDASDHASDGAFAIPSNIPPGLADELLALCAFVLSELASAEDDLTTDAGRVRLVDDCSRSLTNLILQRRGGTF